MPDSCSLDTAPSVKSIGGRGRAVLLTAGPSGTRRRRGLVVGARDRGR
ncbi:hypothetical protein [Nonomuraea sp. NPDC049709]